MTWSSLLRARRILLLSSGVLIACSGDDTSSTPPDTSDAQVLDDAGNPIDGAQQGKDSQVADTSVVTPPGPAYGAKCMGANANESLATDEVAIVRGKAKLPPMDCDNAAMQSSRNHSGYIGQNGWTLTHVEVQGKPGYTGAQFWDRMAYAKYGGSPYYEVVHSVADAHEAITGKDGWINTLYHRIPFVAYNTLDYGFGAASGGGQTSTMDFGSGNTAPKTALTSWPADGDTAVWTTFHNAYESPNPLPNQQVAGYPISVSGGGALVIATHDITDGSNAAVDHVTMNSGNDPVKLIPAAQVYFIPKSVLSKNTKYTTHVTGTVSGAAFDVTFSFTTGGT